MSSFFANKTLDHLRWNYGKTIDLGTDDVVDGTLVDLCGQVAIPTVTTKSMSTIVTKKLRVLVRFASIYHANATTIRILFDFGR